MIARATVPAAGTRGDERVADVTAVVVSYNSARHFPQLVQALSAGSATPAKLLVVDNASTDDSVDRARDAGFDVRRAGSNNGFGAACNIALKAATTEYMLICNPDVLPPPAALDCLLSRLGEYDDAAIAGVAFDRPYRARRFSTLAGNLTSFLPGRLQRRLERYATEVSVDASASCVSVDYVVGAYMLCRVSALRSVGGFDERFFLYSEEEDLCRRLETDGWKTLFVPAVTVDHRHSTSTNGVNAAAMAAFRFHSLHAYYRKHRSPLYAELARVAIASCILADRAYRTLTRQGQVYGPGAVTAAFRRIDFVRRDWERRYGT